MEQLVVILIAAVVGILNWMLKRQDFGGSQPPDPTLRNPPAESEEERMRKFMEALGMPAGSAPPKMQQRRIQPRQEAQPAQPLTPRRVKQRRAEPMVFSAKSTTAPAPTAESRSTEPAPGPVPALYEVNLHEQSALKPQVATMAAAVSVGACNDATTLAALLRKPESLRTAFVLKEILGAPRALQELGGSLL